MSSPAPSFYKLSKELVYISIGIAVTILIITLLVLGRASTQKTAYTPPPTYVTIEPLTAKDYPKSYSTFGRVMPAKEVQIRPQISGKVVSIAPNLYKGSQHKKGEVLFTLEDADYQSILKERQAALSHANLELKVEKSRQIIAEKEWELLEKDFFSPGQNKDLALRKPHIRLAQAKLEAAKSQVNTAKRTLEKAKIKAPFDGFIKNDQIEQGQFVTPSSLCAIFVGTHKFHVEASIPWKFLPDIMQAHHTQTTYQVHIHMYEQPENTFDGYVMHLIPDLTPQSTLAKLLVEVPNPLKTKDPQSLPLFLSSFVEVKFPVASLTQVIKIPRKALRDQNSIWLMQDNKLHIQIISPVYQDFDSLYVDDPSLVGQNLVTSFISAPLEGIQLEAV